MIESMFHLHLPVLEKILRPIIVYLCLVVFVRLFGKRELAQLNPFDLIVLLCLSNTVQNSIIGDDNSVSGGIVGVFSLLGINFILTRILFRFPALNRLIEGKETVLIRDGKIDIEAVKQEALTELELKTVLHKQGLKAYSQVQRCVLEPSGNFYVEEKDPLREGKERDEILRQITALTTEVKELKTLLAARG
ncbi:MAG TPA: YetF domain-containing protein [Edaphobacter sp.]|nr:YetF domain-containing protein [Edaphobacter sp.]